MNATDRSRAEIRGPQALTRAFRRVPVSTSEPLGWRDLRVCAWRVEVEEYELPPLPELLVALHTAGRGVDRRDASAWAERRSFPGLGTIRPPGVSDRYRVGGDFGCVTVHIPLSRIEALAESIGGVDLARGIRFQFAVEDPLVVGVVRALADEVSSPCERGSLLADHWADALVLHLIRRSRRSEPRIDGPGRLGERALARVREKIDACLGDPLTLADLAREAGLSSFYFARAFKRTTGKSPHRYLTERRIERAKTLLRETALPLVEIALATGFASQQHFTDVFHRHAGAPPARHRRAHRIRQDS